MEEVSLPLAGNIFLVLLGWIALLIQCGIVVIPLYFVIFYFAMSRRTFSHGWR